MYRGLLTQGYRPLIATEWYRASARLTQITVQYKLISNIEFSLVGDPIDPSPQLGSSRIEIRVGDGNRSACSNTDLLFVI